MSRSELDKGIWKKGPILREGGIFKAEQKLIEFWKNYSSLCLYQM